MQQQDTKEKLLQTFIIEVGKNTKYSSSIFKKYIEMGKEYQRYGMEIQKKSGILIDGLLSKEDFKGVTKEKLLEYMKTDKMPPKIKEEITTMRNQLFTLVNTEKVKYPMFNWLEKRYMNVILVDILNYHGLIDKRKLKCFFKTLYKEI
jgi:hypothetical protein